MIEEHSQHVEDHTGHFLLLGAAGAAGALILAPYVLPILGIGTAHTAHMMMSFIGGETAPGFYGSGIAGALQKGIASIPGVGSALTSTAEVVIPGIGLTLTAGALTTILASAAIGIGGMLLANWVEKHEQASDKIHWSKIIRAVSLATSILISLPSILTGISVGITFLADLLNTQWGNQAAYMLSSEHSLGALSMAGHSSAGTGALSGLMAVLPHLITCGGAVLPVMLAMFMAGKKDSQITPETCRCELVSATPTRSGEACIVSFRLRDAQGKPLTPNDLATIHTKKIHTMIVDSSLNDYHHLHPVYDPASGLFTCQFTPQSGAPYKMWNDLTLNGANQSTPIVCDLPSSARYSIPAHISQQSRVTAGDARAEITSDAPLRAGTAAMLTITLRDGAGQPLTHLEPIMGAYAHLAAFSADGQHFSHIHPVGYDNGALTFHLTPEIAGGHKFFLQIQRDGAVQTIPFGQVIAPSLSFVKQAETPSHQHTAARAA